MSSQAAALPHETVDSGLDPFMDSKEVGEKPVMRNGRWPAEEIGEPTPTASQKSLQDKR
jgi:hypothetical protein